MKRPAKLDLGDYLPYLVNRVGSIIADQFGADALARHDLSIAMWRVMAALAANGRQRQIDLADLTSIDSSTLSRLVTRLVQIGIVTRTRSTSSNREVVVKLSAKGNAVVGRLIPIALDYERAAIGDLSAQELRTRLWRVAERLYPTKRGEMENELRQTLFVMGAIRRLVDNMPENIEGFQAVFDIGMEMGQIWGAEKWKYVHFEELKKRDASWWRKKKGDASPNQVAAVLMNSWFHSYHPKEKGVKRPSSKWEVLIDMLGTREMCALATLEKIVLEDGDRLYSVEGDDCSFQVMAKNDGEFRDGRYIVHQRAGEIVG